jgi:hypothetical protein
LAELKGLAVRFYRGIGEKKQNFGPLSKMNILIGENNSGKSTFLDLPLFLLSDEYKRKRTITIDEASRHQGKDIGRPEYFIGFDWADYRTIIEKRLPVNDISGEAVAIRSHSERLFGLLQDNTLLWVDLADGPNALRLSSDSHEKFTSPPFNYDEWKLFRSRMTGRSGGGWDQWISDVINFLSAELKSSLALHRIIKIPAKREISYSQDEHSWPEAGTINGDGFVSALHKLQNPAPGPERRRTVEKFDNLNRFLSDLLGKKAKLEVTSEKEALLVSLNDKELRLEELGTGIHEIILLAAISIYYDDAIVCIEEPELHLHPALQRKLIHFLQSRTTNQYIISTHSAVFIDLPDATIFHVKNDEMETSIELSMTKDDRRDVLDSLGALASDILQANVVLWVEGPSDRILIRKWLSQADSELIEGLHYTTMFYGGALVAHLSTSDHASSDEAIGKFIKLQDLNRNVAIVLDSDKEKSGAKLKKHVDRISEELKSRNGFVWITAGREIENYLDGDKVQETLKEIHKNIYDTPASVDRYDHVFYFNRKRKNNKDEECLYKGADKVALAQRLAESDLDLGVLDLRDRITELAKYIRKANGLTTNA